MFSLRAYRALKRLGHEGAPEQVTSRCACRPRVTDSLKLIAAVSFAESGLLRTSTEAQMSFGASDVIQFKDLNTGGNSAGNGGSGYNKGDLTSTQSANFSPYNKAYGS